MYKRKLQKVNYGNYWFRRLVRDCQRVSPHIKFKRIKYGYVRIYWSGGGNNAYLAECSKDLPPKGYDIYEKDINLSDRKYYEEFEDQIEYSKKIKNFKEGYWDTLDSLKRRIYLMRHSKEHYKTAVEAYKQVRIK